jgi:site-specific DNA-methyltransferase (adenine-specific)
MMAYLAMMAPRLVGLRRVLKETGSIYLHCDPTFPI